MSLFNKGNRTSAIITSVVVAVSVAAAVVLISGCAAPITEHKATVMCKDGKLWGVRVEVPGSLQAGVIDVHIDPDICSRAVRENWQGFALK